MSSTTALTERRTNVTAILALVFAFVVPVVGIVLGVVAGKQIRRTGEGGAGLAKAGLILGIVFTVGYLLLMVVTFAALIAGSSPA